MNRIKKGLVWFLIFVLVVTAMPMNFSVKAYAESLPTVEKGEGEESNIIRISRNGATFTGFNVMYATTELEKSTWKSFCSLGKQQTDVNGSSGYKNLKLAADKECYEYKCERAGYYYFCVSSNIYGIQIDAEDIPEGDPEPEEPDPEPGADPIALSLDGNVITVTRMDSSLSGVTAMYSSVAPERETWYSFYTTGKLNQAVNGKAGYIGYKFNADGVIRYTCKYAGTYYFWAKDGMYSVSVGEDAIPEDEDPTPSDPTGVSFSQSNDIITIGKNGTDEKSVLWMIADTAPSKETWYSFYTTGKQKADINSSKGYQTFKLTEEENEFHCQYAGTYYFWSNNKIYSFTVTDEQITQDPPAPPSPDVLFAKSGNVIHIDSNGSGENSVFVMFSMTDPENETWFSYYTTGKINSQINGKNGYKTLVFSDDAIDYKCGYAGTYYFWSKNKMCSFPVSLAEIPDEEVLDVPEETPDPIIEQSGNTISIHKNESDITQAFWMFSEEEPAALTWNSFVSFGKRSTAVNGTSGYKTEALSEELTEISCNYVGWYSIFAKDKMYKFHVGEENFTEESPAQSIPEEPVIEIIDPIITKSGNKVTVQKNGAVFDKMLVMYSENEVERETWTTFYTVGKVHPEINTASGYRTVSASNESTTETYFRAGHYYYWINNVEYHIELTSDDVPEHRYAEVSLNKATFCISENGADVTSLCYTYTTLAPEYTNDEFSMDELAEMGKTDREANSDLGYVSVSGPYDGKKITVRKPGFYTFVIEDESGQHYHLFEIEAENVGSANAATASMSNNVISISDNDSNLTSVYYMYSDSYYFYTNTNEFVAKGKEDIESNTKYGYRAIKQRNVTIPDELNPEDEITVPTFDGVTFNAEKAGYYVLQFTDDSGKHGMTFHVTQEAIDVTRPSVSVNRNIITVSAEELEDVTIKSISYVCTPEETEYTTWADMVACGKENTAINGTKGYLTANAGGKISNITCKAPGYYMLLISYVTDDAPTNTLVYSKTVEVNEYLAEIKLLLDNVSCNAGALVMDKDATDEYRESNKLYAKAEGSEYIELDSVKTGTFSKILAGGKEYKLFFGTESEKTPLGTAISDSAPGIKLDYFSTKLTLTDLDAQCNPYALRGETYRVTLSTGDRPGKQLPLKITVRQEGLEVPYSYNNVTGVVTIPNVNGRVTIKAMANKRYNHVNIKLNVMGGNIYDATWGSPVNYVYSANDISGESVLLPTPMAPANSTTVNFAGWYKDINYTNKVTSINTDEYTEGETISLYAKWILSSSSKETSSMYYAYRGSVFDIRGVKSRGNYIKTTYSDGGYTNYYYYSNGSAYPYSRNGSSNYGGTQLTFVNSTNESIFKRLNSTDIYYAQVMADQGSYVTVNYIFVNIGNTDVTNLTFGACADVQIASNDSAAINAGRDANGDYLVMEDGQNYAFRLYTLDANQYWIGGYSSSYCYNGKGFSSNVFNDSSMNSNHYDKKFVLGRDSALAFSFINQRVPANGAIMKSVKLGVGTMAEMGKNSGANITLIGAGGTWNGDAIKILTSSSSTMSIAGSEPVRDGYRFIEWNSSSDGRGTKYSTNATVGSATLYAIWEKIVPPSYTVYNKSVVKNASNYSMPASKADITIFYNSGQSTIDQAGYEVEAASADSDFNATLKLNTEEVGYCLPNAISVFVGGKALVEGTDYIYSHEENSDTGDITIKAEKINGDITITAIGISTPVKIPVLSLDEYHEYGLRDVDDIVLNVENKDTDNQTYYYRWYKAPTNVNTNGTAISQSTDTLHISSSTTANAGTYYYYCVVTATRTDNKQSAKVVSDVVTVRVNKKAIESSSVVADRDEEENIIGYHVSSNPGNGAITYTYYVDEGCTVKTSAVDGAGITGGMPTVTGEYFVKAHIAESENYLSYDTEPAIYYVTGLPVVMQDGRNITIMNNDSALSSYKVMYSTDFYEYTTWAKYVAKGKEEVAVNGKAGYRGASGVVEGTASSLDNTKISLNKAGYYTFMLSYAGGKTYTTCILVSEPDLISGVPYVTQEYVNDNCAILVNNNNEDLGSLKVVRYIFTGNTRFETDKWATFVSKGKENIAANTSSGYKMVKPSGYKKLEVLEDEQEFVQDAEEGEEGAVLSLDGERILLPRSGYYMFWLSYTEMDGTVREKQMVVHAGQDITGLDSVGMNITYFDTTSTGQISRIDYQYFAEEEPEIVSTGIQPFTSDKKVSGSIARGEETAECSFQVDRYGWYLVRVMDSGEVGTKYYKTYIGMESSDDYKIVLIIDGGLIKAIDSEDETNLITKIKFAEDANYKKGNAIVATSTGIHDINVVDGKGYTYSLKANVLTLERSTEVSTASLEKLIGSATNLVSGCQLVETTDGITVPGTYAPNSAAVVLNSEIENAVSVVELKETQAIVNEEYKTLQTAINSFKTQILVIDARLVRVSGSSITVEPSAEDYHLSSLIFNVNNKTDKVLVPMAFASWAGISGKPYTKVLSFPDRGYSFNGVGNGVYTFLINQEESGSVKAYTEYAVVHEGTTEKAVATSELNRYIVSAKELIGGLKRGADAAGPGEKYVPEANYDLLANAISSAETMKSELENPENTLDTYDDVIPEMIKLHAAIISAENKISTKPLVEPTALVINTEDYHDVVITKSDLAKVSVAYGEYNTWSKYAKAGYVSLPVVDGRADYTEAQYNGIYTALCTYEDGTALFETFEITAIEYPFSISQNSGIITLDLEETEAVSVGYQYGELFSKPEGDFLPIELAENTATYNVPALGNGIHTLYVKTADHVYYQKINVDSCDGPVIVEYNGKLGIFTHGFSYSYVAYKEYDGDAGYNDWNLMYADAEYCGQNQWYPLTSFSANKYTFLFSAADSSQSVFKDYEIIR